MRAYVYADHVVTVAVRCLVAAWHCAALINLASWFDVTQSPPCSAAMMSRGVVMTSRPAAAEAETYVTELGRAGETIRSRPTQDWLRRSKNE